MLVLGLDTATWFASVGVVDGEHVLAEESVHVRTGHTDILLPLVQHVLDQAQVSLADIDGFGISIGPGSFSGLRVGLSTVKGFCYALGRPVIGISTLEALAATVSDWQGKICVLLDARRKEVYAAFFLRKQQGQLQRVTPDTVTQPDELLPQVTLPCLFIGDGAEVYRELIQARYDDGSAVQFLPWQTHHTSGAAVARLALPQLQAGKSDNLQQLVPRYIRVSDAERKRQLANQKAD